MNNQEIAQLLRNVAAAFAIKDQKKYYFQLLAYQKAADTIASMPIQVIDLYQEGRLNQIPNVGVTMRERLEELFTTGRVKHFETVMNAIPPSVFVLLQIPSFGPKKAYKLVTAFNLNDKNTVKDDLYRIAEEGRIAELESFGEKSQADIIRALDEFKLGAGKTTRMVLPFASEIAEHVLEYLQKSSVIKDVQTLGSLRRRKETVGDIDIAVSSASPEEAITYFLEYPYKARIIEHGPSSASMLLNGGQQVDLMVMHPEGFGSLIQHFTGSKAHNVQLRAFALKKGFSLSEYGVRPKNNKDNKIAKKFKTEEEFYDFLGLEWIPPEIREGTGELELAQKHVLPQLIELKDIKGDLHLHSSYPIEPSHDMGRTSMEHMIIQAKAFGYSYVGFSEHNPSVNYHDENQMYSILEKRKRKIDDLNKSNKSFRVISLLETDILVSGKLAIDNKSLNLLDGTLVSIHSSFKMNREDMTKRVLEGLSHPKAKILTHPTGRLLNERAGYQLDWDEIFDFCVKYNKALEINSSPSRLDLPDILVRDAVKHGVKFIINTDSHEISQMTLMQYGVSVARRGWATKNEILNSLKYNEFITWLKNE